MDLRSEPPRALKMCHEYSYTTLNYFHLSEARGKDYGLSFTVSLFKTTHFSLHSIHLNKQLLKSHIFLPSGGGCPGPCEVCCVGPEGRGRIDGEKFIFWD